MRASLTQLLLLRIVIIIDINEEPMKLALKHKSELIIALEISNISNIVKTSFAKIAPFWPLKNLIATNPLQGFEDLPIEDALKSGAAYFEQIDLPQEMELVNIETIKWLQVYFDDGQATISMPLREHGLYTAWRKLVIYDDRLCKNIKQNREFLCTLPETPEQAIAKCLLFIGITKEEHEQFIILLLTTLPGWSAYIKYRTEWSRIDANYSYGIAQVDYVAIRIVILSLLWPQGKKLLNWHQQAMQKPQNSILEKIQMVEQAYRLPLLEKLAKQTIKGPHIPEAQLVFCIDVRSEPFRKKLETIGDYQTFGISGFFGIPVKITDITTEVSHASCPVLLNAKHEIRESPCTHHGCARDQKGYKRLTTVKRLYQSIKYTFAAPFALVETLGIFSATWMGLRSILPSLASKIKNLLISTIRTPQATELSLENIDFGEQCIYAENALRIMGLTHHFAPLIVFCGHGSATQNNAHATALDCGACGGQNGTNNARILVIIMNKKAVREYLAKNGIVIPEATRFIAAQHNTTTDEVALYYDHEAEEIQKLKNNLKIAGRANSVARLKKMQVVNGTARKARLRSQDWAQIRPEWGLARNAAFIIAPRDLTISLDLDGRCFLHSYCHQQDPQGLFLTTILTAPMVVAQWINMQYFFSTIDNVAYGSGSKITANVMGKIGIMQGNASDLMTGLPLQSVYSNDVDPYHEPQRLMTVVLAPRIAISKIINEQPVLKKLFGNGWVQMVAIEPDNHKIYLLNRDFLWQEMN